MSGQSTSMKIHLLGNTGYLGSQIESHLQEKGHDVEAIKTDVTDLEKVREALKNVQDSVVINATGKTGSPNVDWCEDHRLETAAVNITGAINVAQVASQQGNYVVQIGSGCIFSGGGDQAFGEDDEPNFFGSFYSQTKAIAEGALREIPSVCVLRIRMPLQGKPHPKNLLDKLLQYQKILSVPNSVTIIEDFLPFLERVIEKKITGVLNAVNPGQYEHKDLLELYRERIDSKRSFEYISLEQFTGMTKAQRSNCVLSTKKCEGLGIAMPSVQESLPKLIDRYGANVAL
jgi:3,5-epimerase/4-reductase